MDLWIYEFRILVVTKVEAKRIERSHFDFIDTPLAQKDSGLHTIHTVTPTEPTTNAGKSL